MICIYHSRDLDGWMSAAIVKYLDLSFISLIIAKEIINTLIAQPYRDWETDRKSVV